MAHRLSGGKRSGELMRRLAEEKGFATLEILVSAALIAIALLSIATMYLTAHASVERSGDTTVAVALARRMVEDMRSLPYPSLNAINGLDTDNPTTLPANDPERDIARRWRYAVAGESAGWTYTAAEKAAWPTFVSSGLSTRGRVEVTAPSTSMRAVKVSLTVPGRTRDVELATLISRTTP